MRSQSYHVCSEVLNKHFDIIFGTNQIFKVFIKTISLVDVLVGVDVIVCVVFDFLKWFEFTTF